MLIANGSTTVIPFFLTSTADNVTGVTGASPVVTISKAGGNFGSPSGSVAEIANGWYDLTTSAADTGTNGALILHVAGVAATYNPYDEVHQVGAPVADTYGTTTLLSRLPQPLLFDLPGNVKANTQAYGTGEDPASLVLVTAAYKLATDASGYVTANNGEFLTGTEQTELATAASGGGGSSVSASFSDLRPA
jgi:hypothetical protein